ncbi:MAG: autotransporter outer membrane beta-barrel domain-containing protein, partial [Candidatus Zixiibacteriota bacterium]
MIDSSHKKYPRVRKGKVLLQGLTGLSVCFIATTVHAAPTLTEFTLGYGVAGVTTGTFQTGSPALSSTGSLSGTGYTYNYAAQVFTPSATGAYTFGMSSAPTDTVMILYSGSFDPNAPANNAINFNDDSDGLGAGGVVMGTCGGRASLCPKMTENLTGSTNYHVVISTYNSGSPVDLPIGFYVYGEPVVVGAPPPPPPPPPPALSVLASAEAMNNSPAYGGARLIDNTPALLAFFTNSGLSGDQQISDAATQTLPLLMGGSQIAARAAMTGINRVIQARIEANRGLSSGDSFAGDEYFWMKPFGSWVDQGDRKGVSGFDANTAGIAFGIDGVVSANTRLGAALVYVKANVNGNSIVAPHSADIDVYQLVGYGSHALSDDTEINFHVGIGQNKNLGRRSLNAFGLTARSDYKSLTATAGIGVGRLIRLSETDSFTPSIRADYGWIKDKAYTETGAGLWNLNVPDRENDELILAVDGKYMREIAAGMSLSVNLGLGYDVFNNDSSITAAYAGAPTIAFTTPGLDPSPWLVRAGLGVAGTTQGGVEVTA